MGYSLPTPSSIHALFKLYNLDNKAASRNDLALALRENTGNDNP
jgi:hypothetical protein